ncbi:MAG: bifunctional demethylmenaquinone methyltransferase/2-methoxy-6-polyprenyl-1,4-benzoquinol methylase UbiE [Thermodesulfobacterium geofontis]|uniref:Demethylmenaquinone methyltransferase n=1 Tax=Thermodesulfobacterium geofontis TaxID=1295609 RepID=A0A2N7PNX8_9BACT|nr:MAG: bifunctional demethylmenaquinone methyltransferase/2-methoxy-6-polyprenyl-1,4-benzoquinol methylase UbiE [Thermodesulfobacterium geofontis]PMP97833.1 MAG: bifunctional demethylmenaquinone methyltransferase/2-methoxy-6-polyprenyl-1,4-benzoquinol methylase UbiE [Thermodesulfobacterium geofontis]
MKKDKKFIKEKFDKIVKRYDLVNLIGSFGQDKLWRKKVAQVLKSTKPPILDLCCGPYTLSIEIFKKNFYPLFALDFSFSMLYYGKKRISNYPIYPVCADAEVLPFKENTFGGISIAFGLRNLTNIKGALKEFYRVLNPKGKLVILEFSWPKNKIFQKIYQIYLEKYIPLLGGFLTGDKSAYLYLADSIKKFPSPEEIKNMLLETGFTEVKYEPLTMDIVTLYTAYKA